MEKSNAKWTDWGRTFLLVVLAAILYCAVQSAGWLGGLNVQDKQLTLGISFLVGVAASFSSCLAVVGGMVIAFSEKYHSNARDGFFSGAVWPNVKFHVGRILTFFALGGMLGLAGGKINLNGNFISVYTIIIAVVMGWLGLNILGFAPSLSSLGIRTPKFLVRCWARLENSDHQAVPYLLGGLTFFLPCGFTQSMQIFALASGSFLAGALIMSAFALGTMPVLLALGASVSWASVKKLSFFNKAAGIIIIAFSIYTFSSGLALWDKKSNASGNFYGSKQQETKKDNTAGEKQPAAAQKVDMKITSRGFEPSVLRVKNNIPVQFVINGDQTTGCTNKIVIPDLDIAKDIKKGENIIEFTPKKIGPVAYSCWMGMVRGKIIVE
ncbi:MAG: sulfite exporter TauE/SafE family protein [Patescibacteria group bacterium]|nr:sulfite exporter TauE/SafE family protein [Patescibacteria group bacterium]